MLLDIHLHSSRHSKCSKADPIFLVRQAAKKGVQGVVITEHNYQWTREELDTLKREGGVHESFLVLAGQELKTEIGDVLVYGAPDTIGEKASLERLREAFPKAAIVWAHPFRSGKVPSGGELKNPLIDAVEVFNLNHLPKENYLALKLWHELKFNAVAGSDAHNDADSGIFSTQFLHPVKDILEFVREIKLGRCMPFVKEIPRAGSNLVLTEIVMGTKGADESRTRLITKRYENEKSWGKAKASLQVREFLYKNGFDSGKYRVPKTLDIDEAERLYIEEGQRGASLFDTMSYVSPGIGAAYFRLTAEWLAKMHALKGWSGTGKDTFGREDEKFSSYLESFVSTGNPYRDRAGKYIDLVKKEEYGLYAGKREGVVLCHGDFHPKNIIIGQDRARDINTLFVSVIDFDSSRVMPPEADVGGFISQFLYQMHSMPEVLEKYKSEDFIEAYRSASGISGQDIGKKIMLFRLRTNLSIASFLIKVGKGESPDMDIVIKDSEELYQELSG